jgi:hypothetical protein
MGFLALLPSMINLNLCFFKEIIMALYGIYGKHSPGACPLKIVPLITFMEGVIPGLKKIHSL